MPQWVGIKIAIMRMGIHVYYALNDNEAEMFIKRLNERVGEEKEWEKPAITKKKNRTTKEVCYDVLMAFDGIGFKTAKKLFERYGNLSRIFTEYDDKKMREVLEYDCREDVESS
jgi:ERCC4-type nuclease